MFFFFSYCCCWTRFSGGGGKKKINEHEWIKQIRVTKVRECGGGLLMTIKRQRKIIFGVNNANTHTHSHAAHPRVHVMITKDAG